ncbi:MAG: amidohydrolase [Hydrocarboniphaga sp.]|uniref:carbon-nitrogen hydrolase family protein n=1 Tax=Hydrocarboniphaga sp. TaxID=2033016 RepID=UPI0026028DF1|nr:carbon-nitrogen hydrolase family protein [Hydrocarboniphaga sp.]MDB5970528.1 amidohydrolase [Hydrocarboniphaga sp.]
MSGFIAATSAYPVSTPGSWTEVEDQLSLWVAEAADKAAQLLVFPEYAAMSLAALFGDRVRGDLAAQLDSLQSLRDDYVSLHQRLAQRHGVHILAGSFPWRCAPARFHNRAWLCTPDGGASYQDKQIMTRFEREIWAISSGDPQRVFDTALGRIGVAICYDAEFPLLARAQVQAGAEILLVPSCTDALAGYHRVRVAAQARALESQCYVLVSPLVGEAAWSPAIDVNVGAAGVYGPPDRGFPDDGVVAQGVINAPGWVYAEIDLDLVRNVRANGQVLNYAHWPEQAP